MLDQVPPSSSPPLRGRVLWLLCTITPPAPQFPDERPPKDSSPHLQPPDPVNNAPSHSAGFYFLNQLVDTPDTHTQSPLPSFFFFCKARCPPAWADFPLSGLRLRLQVLLFSPLPMKIPFLILLARPSDDLGPSHFETTTVPHGSGLICPDFLWILATLWIYPPCNLPVHPAISSELPI